MEPQNSLYHFRLGDWAQELPFKPTLRGNHHKSGLTLMQHAQQGLPFRFCREAVEVCNGLHFMSVNAQDDVALFEKLCSRAVWGNVRNNNSMDIRRYPELFTQRLRGNFRT